jgi:hypothetical protein
MPPKPLDLGEPPPRSSRPPASPPPGAVAAGFCGLAKWLLLGAGTAIVAAALVQSAPWAAALAGVACFAGIAARIFQAEEHHHRGR